MPDTHLSKNWRENGLPPHTIYYTTDVMPPGAELRIRVNAIGTPNTGLYVYDFHDGGVSHSVASFPMGAPGQVLSYKLTHPMNVGIAIGSPAQAACAGITPQADYHTLNYDFGNLGRYSIDAKVVSGPF